MGLQQVAKLQESKWNCRLFRRRRPATVKVWSPRLKRVLGTSHVATLDDRIDLRRFINDCVARFLCDSYASSFRYRTTAVRLPPPVAVIRTTSKRQSDDEYIRIHATAQDRWNNKEECVRLASFNDVGSFISAARWTSCVDISGMRRHLPAPCTHCVRRLYRTFITPIGQTLVYSIFSAKHSFTRIDAA